MTTDNHDKARALDQVRARLAERAPRYEFFRAVRSLLLAGGGEPVGGDAAPGAEVVRFVSHASITFPGSQVVRFQDPPRGEKADATRRSPAEMTVTFLGLTGPAGVMPRHYTEELMARVRGKDYALRDFLGMFDHRLVSFFYRAWEKHRVGALLEDAESSGERDRFTAAVSALVALGPAPARERFEFHDRLFLYYSGIFSRSSRSESCLRRLLQEHLGVAVAIRQFVGHWLRVERADQTSLPSLAAKGQNCRLGLDSIAGERVWDVQSRFRVQLGPMGYDQFRRLMPNGDAFLTVGQLVRSYVGPGYDYDVQPVLRRDEIPACRLGDERPDAVGPRLGWNTWVLTHGAATDAEDAVFVSDGAPSR
ncbi:MAG: type VI secretion system baseplate subunit TssG [Planctomycetota bacterium]